MGFLDDSKTINPVNPTQGGFLNDSRKLTERELQVNSFSVESDKLKQEAIKAKKLGTILKETGKDLVKKTTKLYKSENEFTWDSYKESPDLLLSDINKDIDFLSKPQYQNVKPDDIALRPGQFNNQPLINGEAKSTPKQSKEQLTASALLKPLSVSLGVMLEKGEIKNLSDNDGNIIVDKNGITDMDNFLKFVSQNDESMEKFINLVNEVSNPKIGKENNKDLPKLLEDLSSSIFNKTIPTNSRQKITPERYLEMVNTWGNDVINSWINVGTQSKEAYKSFKEPNTGTKRFVESAEVGLSALGAFFTPVSSVFLQAETTPGIVGDTAKFANKFFEIVGKVGAEGTGKAIDLYSPFSDKTNEEIKPISMEIGNLVSQILVGRGGELAYKKLGLKTNEFINKISEEARLKQVNQTIPKETLSKWVEQSKEAEDLRNKALPTKEERYKEYLKSQGYEDIIPNEELPTIDFGSKPQKTNKLPDIQIGESVRLSKTKNGEYVYEPIKEGGETAKTPTKETPVAKEESTFTTNKENTESTSSIREHGLAKTLKQEIRLRGIEEDLGKVPTYEVRPTKIKEADDFVQSSSVEESLAIARGEKSAPNGIYREEIISALKRKIVEENNIPMIMEVFNDKKMNTLGTELGRRVQALDTKLSYNIFDNAEEVRIHREGVVKQKQSHLFKYADVDKVRANYTTDIKKKITQEVVSKNANKKQSLVDFVKSIQC